MQAVVAAAMAVQTLLFAATAAPPAALFPSPTSARPFHRASNFRGASIRPSPPQRPSAASPVLPLAVEEDEAAAAIAGEGQRRGGGSSNRIQVSNTKKPLFFYVNLAKIYRRGLVDFKEFVAATLHIHQMAELDSERWGIRCQAAFSKFDLDGDGYITPDELRMVQHTGLKGSIEPLLEEANIDKDGE